MVKKCVYCSKGIGEDSAIDVCTVCGRGVWGEKMFSAIVKNMEQARDKGDLVLNHEVDELDNGF